MRPDQLSWDDDETLALLARAMTQSGRFRIVERLERRPVYHPPDGTPTRTALFVDLETTGLDNLEDRILQLAAVPFTYAPADGRIFEVGEALVYLEDPGIPIPDHVTDLTGIGDIDVAGQRIDDERVSALVRGADLVIAHNAAFDRPFAERRLEVFRDRPWACSCAEPGWRAEGLGGAQLEWLLYKQCGLFYDGHRADQDCYAGIHLLTTRLPSGTLALDAVLRASRRRGARVRATGAPFAAKEALKARRYRWNDGGRGAPRAWWTELPAEAVDAELAWLAREVYGGREGWTIEWLDARNRYSARTAAPSEPLPEW